MQRILIIKPRYLGDLMLALPIINIINHLIPDAKIDLVINKMYKDLLAIYSIKADTICLTDKNSIQDFYVILDSIKTRKYDLLIDLTAKIDSILLSLFFDSKIKTGFCHEKKIISFFTNTIYNQSFCRNREQSELLQNCNFLTFCNCKTIDLESVINQYPLHLDAKLIDKKPDLGQEVKIGIHPFASRKTKIWPHCHVKEYTGAVSFNQSSFAW